MLFSEKSIFIVRLIDSFWKGIKLLGSLLYRSRQSYMGYGSPKISCVLFSIWTIKYPKKKKKWLVKILILASLLFIIF